MAKKIVCPRCQNEMRKMEQSRFCCLCCGVTFRKVTRRAWVESPCRLQLENLVLMKEVIG